METFRREGKFPASLICMFFFLLSFVVTNIICFLFVDNLVHSSFKKNRT